MNIHWIHCIENIFTVQDFWAICACLKNSSPENFHFIEYISYHSGFLSNSALALKNRVCPEMFHCIEYTFYIQDFWVTCACPEKQRVPWIHCIEYIFFTVTCVEVRGWGSTVSFKAKFASLWIAWSSINSPVSWLLAEWLLLVLRIPYRYHNLLHTHRYIGDSKFEKSTI